MTTAERREQLRLAKQAQRKRDRNARRKLDPDASAQLTLTLSTGDKEILREIAEMEEVSMSQVLINLLHRHKKYHEAKSRLAGFFPHG